jgi:predicted nucleic acid-binding protein
MSSPVPAPRIRKTTSTLRGAGDVVELRTGDAREAAALARRTLDEGTFAGWSEVLIGGVAENRGGLPIVTGNAHHFPAQETITYG